MNFFDHFLAFIVQIFKIIFFFTATMFMAFIMINWFIYTPAKDRGILGSLFEKVSAALSENFTASSEEQACLSMKSIPKNYIIWCAAYHPRINAASDVVENDLPYNITRKYKNNKCIFTVFGEGILAGNSYNINFSCSVDPNVVKTCQNETPFSRSCVQKANVTPINDD